MALQEGPVWGHSCLGSTAGGRGHRVTIPTASPVLPALWSSPPRSELGAQSREVREDKPRAV